MERRSGVRCREHLFVRFIRVALDLTEFGGTSGIVEVGRRPEYQLIGRCGGASLESIGLPMRDQLHEGAFIKLTVCAQAPLLLPLCEYRSEFASDRIVRS